MSRKDRWKTIDKFKRKLFLKYEIKRVLLKSISKNTTLPFTHRHLALYNKSKLTRSSSKTQQKSKCVETGRVWSVVKLAHYSRFAFRRESYSGNIPGFRRASW